MRPRSIRRCAPSMRTGPNLPYELSSFIGREHEQDDVARRLGANPAWCRSWASAASARPGSRCRSARSCSPATTTACGSASSRACSIPTTCTTRSRPRCGSRLRTGVSVEIGLQQFFEHKRLLLDPRQLRAPRGRGRVVRDRDDDASAGVSVLATSREALGVRGEHISPLASFVGSVGARSRRGARVGSRRAVRGAARESRGDLVLDERDRGRRARAVRAARRHPARARARRRADRDDDAERDRASARPAVPAR